MNTDFNYSSVASLIQAAEKNNLPRFSPGAEPAGTADRTGRKDRI